jgi:hypothetical protein
MSCNSSPRKSYVVKYGRDDMCSVTMRDDMWSHMVTRDRRGVCLGFEVSTYHGLQLDTTD